MGKDKIFCSILITVFILLVLFGGMLFFLKNQGYLSIKENGDNCTNNVEKNNCNFIDLTKLGDFKNYDGTYGTIDSLRKIPEDYSFDYNVSLSLDGIVSVFDFNNGTSHIINVSDVVQISSSDAENCYLLDKNNQVYVYELVNFAKENYNATKLDNANNIVRLLSINYGPVENAGGASVTVGIKADGSYVSLDGFRR